MSLTRAAHFSCPRASEGSRVSSVHLASEGDPHVHLQLWTLLGPEPQPCSSARGGWRVAAVIHSSMSVSGPCGHREGGDGLYPSTGLSCMECVALVEIQDLRPGYGGQKALGHSTRGNPELRVGAEAARALSRLETFLFPSPPSGLGASISPF